MEGLSDQPPAQPDQPTPEKHRFDAANDFLTVCDRLSTGYDSGYYWEDVQRALRIAAGLEKWPDWLGLSLSVTSRPVSNLNLI